MVEFRSFNSFEDMFEAIERGVQQANARATDEQRAITWGDHWLRFFEDFAIFGEIYTLEFNLAEEKRLGATKAELDYTKKSMLANYDRGFRFGMAYSVIVPEGELGDTHIADMIPITKEQFEEARERNWNMDNFHNVEWFHDIINKILEENP